MPHRRWIIPACLILIVATLAVYGEVRQHPFITLDDNAYVTKNPQVQQGLTLDGVVWAFTTLHAGYWLPVLWLSHMLDCQLFGLQAGGHHLTNLFFHLANTLLLFFWLLRTTRAVGRSFVVAALFALHPLRVESVAWVAERKDVLSTFFWLLTMWVYLWYVETPKPGRYLLILVCFTLGLMAKPMLVTLPLVLLLLDYWPLGRLPVHPLNPAKDTAPVSSGTTVAIKTLIWEKVPLLGLAALFSILTFAAQKIVGAVIPLEQVPLAVRLPNALVSYVGYLGKMLWPSPLAVFYPLMRDPLLPLYAVGAALLLAGLSFLAVRQARRRPYLLVGWLWYLGTMVPVIGLVQSGMQAMADRFTYVPLIGVFVIVAWGLADLADRWKTAGKLLPVGAGVVLAVLMVCTYLQVRHWRDSISLFEHTLRVTGDNPLVHYSLGVAWVERGRADQAIPQYLEALRLRPHFAEVHVSLGNVLASQGQADRAISHYQEALRHRPDFADAHNELGNVLASSGRLDQAIPHFNEAVRLNPNLVEAHYNLGNAFDSLGEPDRAVSHYTQALRLNPNYAQAYNNLGITLATQQKFSEAITMLEQAIKIKPDLSEAYNNLGLIFANQGNTDKAISMFQNAFRINPNNVEAHKILENLKDQKSRNQQ